MRSRAAAAERRRSSSPASLAPASDTALGGGVAGGPHRGDLFLRGLQFVFNGLPLLLQELRPLLAFPR